jgi:hypothetical protein
VSCIDTCMDTVHTRAMTTKQQLAADLDRVGAQLEALGAVITFDDGFQGIDPTKAPVALVGAYSRLMQYGYANGLI